MLAHRLVVLGIEKAGDQDRDGGGRHDLGREGRQQVDAGHDRERGLFSIPVRLGVGGALRLSVALHVLCILFLLAVYAVNPHVGWLYGVGLAAAVALLVYEHAIVTPQDLSRVDLAFYTLNGHVSLVLGAVLLPNRPEAPRDQAARLDSTPRDSSVLLFTVVAEALPARI